jgi:phosphoglucosamine mutase
MNDKSVVNSPEVLKKSEEIRAILQSRGRLILRPSGTEPIVRIYLEGENRSELECMAQILLKVIKKENC